MPIPADARPVNEGSRFSATSPVQALLKADSPEGELARTWVRFAKGLIAEDGVQLEEVTAPELRCFELEDSGFPPGLAGLKAFRAAINGAMPDEWAVIMKLEADVSNSTVETELLAGGTHTGELMGIPATGRTVEFTLRTLGKFDGDRLVRRWDRTDFADLMRQLGAA